MRHNWMEVFELGGCYHREWADADNSHTSELWVENNDETGEIMLILQEGLVVQFQASIKKFGDDQFVISKDYCGGFEDSLFYRLARNLSDVKSDPPQMNQRDLNMFIKRCETILALMIP